MILFRLFITFFKIGLFSFGGGYAMIPMMQKEFEIYQWLSPQEFADIIAIAEMTPGPVAVNSATFVGFKNAGIIGGMAATLGVAAPSLILIMIVSQFFFRFRKHPLNKAIFYGIRPVISGLVFTAAFFIAKTALFNIELTSGFFSRLVAEPLQVINLGSLVIMVASVVAITRFKLHPILVIISSGLIGALLFSFI
jgi:chromate transporter